MMKTKLFLIFILLSSVVSNGQVTFEKVYGGIDNDKGLYVQQTTDNGYIITGQTRSYGGLGFDIFLVKTDQYGDTIWTKAYDIGDVDIGNCVLQMDDDGYLVCGYYNNLVLPDIYLLKTDVYGNKVWDKTIGALYSIEVGRKVKQTPDNCCIVLGDVKAPLPYPISDSDIMLIKIDENGDTIWQKTYDIPLDEYGLDIESTNDDGYIICGTSYQTEYMPNLLVIKTDANGDTLWTRTYGDYNPYFYTYIGSSIKKTSENCYIICGSIYNSLTDYDIWVVKIDQYGEVLWENSYGGLYEQLGYSLEKTIDGGYILCGVTDSYGSVEDDVYIVRIDSVGNKLWEKTFGGDDSDEAYCVKNTSDDAYVIAGYTRSKSIYGGADMYLIKTLDSESFPTIEPLFIDLGSHQSNEYFKDSLKIINYGTDNINVEIFCSSEHVTSITPYSFNLPPTEFQFSIFEGNFPIDTGMFEISIGIVANVDTQYVELTGIVLPSNINELTTYEYFEIYPNPVQEYVSFDLENVLKTTIVQIYDFHGKKVLEQDIYKNKKASVAHLTSGLYFYRFTHSDKPYNGKLIIK